MENETIGQRIRALRRSKKLTQVQLAKIAGVSSPAVTEWEKDGYLPKAASLEAIANKCGLTFFIEIFLFSKNFLACLISSGLTAIDIFRC